MINICPRGLQPFSFGITLNMGKKIHQPRRMLIQLDRNSAKAKTAKFTFLYLPLHSFAHKTHSLEKADIYEAMTHDEHDSSYI